MKGGSRSTKAAMKRGRRVAGEATVRSTPLGAGWRCDPRDDQRNRGETLHGSILRLFGIVGWLDSCPTQDEPGAGS